MAEQHPIQGLMFTAMQSIKEMVDVNTIVGDAVEAPDGTVIIPISKVSFGFGVGGSEYFPFKKTYEDGSLFGGGSGAGASISPLGFMIVGNGQIRLIPINPKSNIYDRILDSVPDAIDKITESIKKLTTKSKCNKAQMCNEEG